MSRVGWLNELILDEFKDKVNWHYISLCQNLSEDFIREFQDKVVWSQIAYHFDKFSNEFKKEFEDKLLI